MCPRRHGLVLVEGSRGGEWGEDGGVSPSSYSVSLSEASLVAGSRSLPLSCLLKTDRQ